MTKRLAAASIPTVSAFRQCKGRNGRPAGGVTAGGGRVHPFLPIFLPGAARLLGTEPLGCRIKSGKQDGRRVLAAAA